MRTDVTIWFHDNADIDTQVAGLGYAPSRESWQVVTDIADELTPEEALRAAAILTEAANLANQLNQNPGRKPTHELTPHNHD